MLTLQGKVLAVIRHQERTARDGKKYEAFNQVQLQVEEQLENGQTRFGIQTMTAAKPEPFERLQGQEIAIPVRAYVRAGNLAFMLPPDAEPKAITHSAKPTIAAAS